MQDLSTAVSLTKLSAILLGLAGFLMVVVNFWLDDNKIAFLGCPLCCYSAILWVRSYFCTMTSRERNAFQVGRDSVTGTSSVRTLH